MDRLKSICAMDCSYTFLRRVAPPPVSDSNSYVECDSEANLPPLIERLDDESRAEDSVCLEIATDRLLVVSLNKRISTP